MRFAGNSVEFRFADAAHGTEAFLELVDAAFGVHKLSEAGEEWVRVGSNADGDHTVLDAIDDLFLVGGFGGTCDEALARGHVNEHDGIVFWMKVLFHGDSELPITFPTRRDAENLQIVRAVKRPSALWFENAEKNFHKLKTCKILTMILHRNFIF